MNEAVCLSGHHTPIIGATLALHYCANANPTKKKESFDEEDEKPVVNTFRALDPLVWCVQDHFRSCRTLTAIVPKRPRYVSPQASTAYLNIAKSLNTAVTNQTSMTEAVVYRPDPSEARKAMLASFGTTDIPIDAPWNLSVPHFVDCPRLRVIDLRLLTAVSLEEEQSWTHKSPEPPPALHKVGSLAKRCPQLTEIRLPSCLRHFGEWDFTALSSCHALVLLDLSYLHRLESTAPVFDCFNLREIRFPHKAPNFHVFGTLTHLPALEEIIVPDSVRRVESSFVDTRGRTSKLLRVRLPSNPLLTVEEMFLHRSASLECIDLGSSWGRSPSRKCLQWLKKGVWPKLRCIRIEREDHHQCPTGVDAEESPSSSSRWLEKDRPNGGADEESPSSRWRKTFSSQDAIIKWYEEMERENDAEMLHMSLF